MNETQQNDRRAVIFRNVRQNAQAQATPEHRENYFKSCEAHGGDLAEITAIIRQEFSERA